MKIAVIGDYNSPQYQTLHQIVKMHFPNDSVIDLSVYQNADFKKREKARQLEIKACHLFIFDSKWDESVEIRQDITFAQQSGKDGFLYRGGQFQSFPCIQHAS
jgi:hypothetical protein